MAEADKNGVVTASVADSVGSQSSVQDGMRSISQADFDRFTGYEASSRRLQESVTGLQPFQEGAKRLGIESADQFGELENLLGAIPKNMSRAAAAELLRATFSEGGVNGEAAAAASQHDEYDAKGEIQKVRDEMALKDASHAHTGLVSKQGELYSASMAEFLGENPSDESKFLWGLAAEQALGKARSTLYDADHVLHGREFKALDQDGVKAMFTALAERRTGFQAADRVKLGDAANTATTKPAVTTAGQAGEQGSSETKNTGRMGQYGVDLNEVDARLAQRRAARSGSAMSSQSR